jgi:hypothetical protein
MNAWLLTWEGTCGPALIVDKKIVAIISSRRSSSAVEEIVDILYRRSVDSAFDMSFLANKRKQREKQYKHIHSQPSRFFYGHNPCIYARIVFNLKVERNELLQMEHVQWTEPAYLQIERPGTLPTEVEPAREKELVRTLRPLSLDIYECED